MRKRVVSLAMAAAMALSLTACGSSSSKTETTAAATEAAKTETTAAAEGAATEAAASGVDTSAWKDKTVTCIVPYDLSLIHICRKNGRLLHRALRRNPCKEYF